MIVPIRPRCNARVDLPVVSDEIQRYTLCALEHGHGGEHEPHPESFELDSDEPAPARVTAPASRR